MNVAPRTSSEAADYNRRAAATGSSMWSGKCQMLQRMARGIPALWPSAISAANHVPENERVHRIADLKRGMVVFFDDPNDSSIYGHIAFIAGRGDPNKPKSDADNVLVWSSDAAPGGRCGLVRLPFFKNAWGDPFLFGATELNGYDFKEFDQPPKPKIPVLGDRYKHAIDDLEKVIAHHKKQKNTRLVKALQRDLAKMKRRYKNHLG